MQLLSEPVHLSAQLVPSGLPQPDGTQLIKAHNRLSDYIGCGIVPEDLEKSG
jgi:hypothetical protein